MKKQLIIDGNNILNRTFYGIRPLVTKDGLPVNAVYGMVSILMKQLETLRPDYAAIAFDLPAPTFRHLQYSEYKANRKGMPDDLAKQLAPAKECAEALGLKVVEIAGYEADDILGTLAEIAPCDTMTYILTGDRDSYQLICDKTHILYVSTNDTSDMGRQEFFDKYGITPEQFVDLKALMGDSSDNIPGVAGIGEKTALKLISENGSLDNVYSNIETINAGKSVREKLISGRENAYISQTLARIDRCVPIGFDFSELEYKGYDETLLLSLFRKLEFNAFIKRLNVETKIFDENKSSSLVCNITKDELLSLDKEVSFYMNGSDIYIHTEKSAYYYNNISFDFPSEFFANNRSITVFDIKSTLHALKIKSSDIISGCDIFDVMLVCYVLNPSNNSNELEKIINSYLDRQIGNSPEKISRDLYDLRKVLQNLLSENKQNSLYFDIELPLAYVLFDMELYGFKVDVSGLAAFSEKLGKDIEKYTEEIYALTGEVFNINSPKQLGEVLFEKMLLPAPKKTKTGFSTSADVLEKLRPYNPVIDKIFEYRQVMKLKSTYADGLAAVADENGRIHTSFNQAVTATGRLSSTEPNLQNIPIRNELGRELRKFFVAESKDYVLIDADYSQIELRLLACISGDERMINAFLSGDDIHAITASQVFGVALSEVTPELRKRAKAVNFGIVYGISDFSLAEDIGVTKFEAKQYIDNYLAKYSGVSSYMTDIKNSARETGFVTTMFGRRRYIPELTSQKAQIRSFGERVAMNSPIQGSAADIIKLAMIGTAKKIKEAGIDARLILQVHDELIVESHIDCFSKASEILKTEMEKAASLPVPMTAEVTSGSSWYN